MPNPFLVVAGVAALAGFAGQVFGGINAAKEAAKQAEFQRGLANLQEQRATYDQIRSARVAAGEIDNAAALTGTSSSSSAQFGSMQAFSEARGNINALSLETDFDRMISRSQQRENQFVGIAQAGEGLMNFSLAGASIFAKSGAA